MHLSQRSRKFANITNFTPGPWSFYGMALFFKKKKVDGFIFLNIQVNNI